MSHPYKRDRRSTSNSRSIDTLAINAIVTSDDKITTLSYELSLEDVPERFHDEIVSVITMSINPNDNEPMMVIVSEDLSENMGNVFMEELVVAIAAINLEVRSVLSTEEKEEEIKMNATTTTANATAAAPTQPVEDVTPKSETTVPATPTVESLFASMSTVEKRLDEHQKRLDKLLTEVENIKANQRTQTKEDSSLGFSGWAAVAAVCGGIAGVGYYFGKR